MIRHLGGLWGPPLLIAVVLAGCGSPPEEPRRGGGATKVVLLGLDGASWNIMRPMLERGALPNLAAAIERGVSGSMASEHPCLSIVLWTSVVTGKTPEEHGIRDWSYIDPETGEKGLMDSTRRRVPALWNIANAARLDAGFANWWATWPAESVDGFIVSEQFVRLKPGENLEQGTFPEELSAELQSVVRRGRWPWLTEQITSGRLNVLSDRGENGVGQDLDARIEQAMFLYGQDFRGEQGLFHLLQERPHPAVLGYLSRKIDVASHYMWEFGADEKPDDDALSVLLEPLYRYEDALLGRLIETVGPDANIVILSDHGFGWETDGFGHEETAPPGIFIATGPAFRSGIELDEVRLYDVLPTVLHVLGLPVASDMAGAVVDDAIAAPGDVAFVESYDFLHASRSRAGISPMQERILKELEALGYVP